MGVITQADIDKHKELESKMDGRVEEVLYQVQQIRTGKDPEGHISDIDYNFNNNMVRVETTEDSHCSCCSYDHYYYDFPLDYLFNDDWQEALKEEVRLKREADLKLLEEREKKSKADIELRERKRLFELQEKYGVKG